MLSYALYPIPFVLKRLANRPLQIVFINGIALIQRRQVNCESWIESQSYTLLLKTTKEEREKKKKALKQVMESNTKGKGPHN